MAAETIPPTLEQRAGRGDDRTVYTHPAYGSVVLTHPQGSTTKLFGSDIGHMGRVRIEVRRAELHRNLSRDWVHPRNDTVVAFELTHSQFAAFITGAGRAEGTPVTLIRAPSTPALPVPGIAEVETKQEVFRREIREAAQSRLKHLHDEVVRLETLINGDKLPKKELREIVANLRRHVEQAPGSLEFVVESAEEALEAATDHARIEIEAFAVSKAQQLGFESLAQMGGATDENNRLTTDSDT